MRGTYWPPKVGSSRPIDKGLHRSPAGNNYSANVQTSQREESVDSGPNPAERNEASQKQQRENKNAPENALGAKEQRRQEAEERLESKQIRHEEQEERKQIRHEKRDEREEVRQEEREERKRERQKARGQEESSL